MYDIPSGSVFYYAIDSQDASGNKVIDVNANNYSSVYTNTQADESYPGLVGSVDIHILNETTAIVSWVTDKLADSTVHIQRTSSQRTSSQKTGSQRTGSQATGSELNLLLGDIYYTTQHSIAIPNISPDDEYQIAVSSRDTTGNVAVLWQGQLNAASSQDTQTSSGTTNTLASQSGGGALDSLTLFMCMIVVWHWRRRMMGLKYIIDLETKDFVTESGSR